VVVDALRVAMISAIRKLKENGNLLVLFLVRMVYACVSVVNLGERGV
jgi:hypothetical protein